MKRFWVIVFAAALAGLVCSHAQATTISTTNSALIAGFQSGATVNNFDAISGRTPQTISAYTSGVAVSPNAFIFNQIPGVQFSVGGMVGVNQPALYSLSGTIAGDANSPPTVLGPVDFSFLTLFGPGAMIEVFFPTKVSRVGFWLNPSLGNALLIAADTNFAFSGLNETTLETFSNAPAGNFVGIDLGTAQIGGFKIIGLGTTGFTIDDFTYGGAGAPPPNGVPEPASILLLITAGSAGLLARRWFR